VTRRGFLVAIAAVVAEIALEVGGAAADEPPP
jgi:hypothetical protein